MILYPNNWLVISFVPYDDVLLSVHMLQQGFEFSQDLFDQYGCDRSEKNENILR